MTTTPAVLSPRLPPLTAPFAPAIDALLARLMPRHPPVPIPPLALFRTLALHPALADAMAALGGFLLGKKAAPADSLATRDRELVIARVCARCGCAYEWGVHATAYGARVGLDAAQLAATARGPADDPAFTPRDQLLIRAVDALHASATLDDALFAELAAHYTPPQLLELCVLAGWYHAIAYVANAARVTPEPWAARFPEDADDAAASAATFSVA